MPDFRKLADENRDKIEQGVEKAVDAGEQRTGKQAPSQVDDRIDQIDPSDGDGGQGDEDRDRSDRNRTDRAQADRDQSRAEDTDRNA